MQQPVGWQDGAKAARENEWPTGRHEQEQHARRTTLPLEGTWSPDLRPGKTSSRHNSEESSREEVEHTSWIYQNIQVHEPGVGHLTSLFCNSPILLIERCQQVFLVLSPQFTHSCTPSTYLTQSLSPFHVSPVTFRHCTVPVFYAGSS